MIAKIVILGTNLDKTIILAIVNAKLVQLLKYIISPLVGVITRFPVGSSQLYENLPKLPDYMS